jgi:hypothetical protein
VVVVVVADHNYQFSDRADPEDRRYSGGEVGVLLRRKFSKSVFLLQSPKGNRFTYTGNRFCLLPPKPSRGSCPGEHCKREQELDDEECSLEFIFARGSPVDDAGVCNLQPKGLVCKQTAQEVERKNDLN